MRRRRRGDGRAGRAHRQPAEARAADSCQSLALGALDTTKGHAGCSRCGPLRNDVRRLLCPNFRHVEPGSLDARLSRLSSETGDCSYKVSGETHCSSEPSCLEMLTPRPASCVASWRRQLPGMSGGLRYERAEGRTMLPRGDSVAETQAGTLSRIERSRLSVECEVARSAPVRACHGLGCDGAPHINTCTFATC